MEDHGVDTSLQVTNVHKEYRTADEPVEVLRGITFSLAGGESLAITGPSGSGKSTLLQIIGTLDEPTSGGLEIEGRDPLALGDEDLARFRNETIGFVFQDHHLLPQYSVLENVLIPALAYPRHDAEPPRDRARELLSRVGLEHRLEHRPAQLSGGERQRVAVARALINAPALLLCDEPTGSLDRATAERIGDLLLELHDAEQTILVGVTHSLELALRFDRRFELREGVCVAL